MNTIDYCLGCDLLIGEEASKYADASTVLAVQKALKALGKSTLDPGKIDGVWGPSTAKAVRALKIEGNQTNLDGGIDDWVLHGLGVAIPVVQPAAPPPTALSPPAAVPPATPAAPPAPTFWTEELWKGGPKVWEGAVGGIALGAIIIGAIALVRR